MRHPIRNVGGNHARRWTVRAQTSGMHQEALHEGLLLGPQPLDDAERLAQCAHGVVGVAKPGRMKEKFSGWSRTS